MKCHAHAEAEAIGVCRICGRGLCAGCADGSPEDSHPMLSCPGTCREMAGIRQELMQREVVAYRDRWRMAAILAVPVVPVGLAMIYFGLARSRPIEEALVLAGGGIVFSAIGLFPLVMTIRHARADRNR